MKQCKQLFLDATLLQYWIARGAQISFLFMFGATLSSAGYNLQEVFLFWMLLYVFQSIALFATHVVPEQWSVRAIRASSTLSLFFCLLILLNGFNAYAYLLVIALIQPALREIIHESIIYVRERRDWGLGVDVATALLNETGKAMGGIFVALIGYLSSVDNVLFTTFIALCVAVCGFYFVYPHKKNSVVNFNVFVDLKVKTLLFLSACHNSLFFGIQFFLSMVLLNFLVGEGFEDNALSFMGVFMSVFMLSGLVINNVIKHKLGKNINKTTHCSLLWQSMACIAFICLLIFLGYVFYNMAVISSWSLIVLLGLGIGFLQGIGTFFSLGVFQFLDIHYNEHTEQSRKQFRKHFMNLNMIFSNVSPGIFLGLVSVGFYTISSIESIIIFTLGIIVLGEVLVALSFYILFNKKSFCLKDPITCRAP